MRRNRFLPRWCIFLFIASPSLLMQTSGTCAAELQPGIPYEMALFANTYDSIPLVVPEGATQLTVSITNGSGDLDLYLTWVIEPPYGLTQVDDLDAYSDVRSIGPTADESITLTPDSPFPLVPGEWWVTVQNLNDSFTTFTLTATLETGSTPEPTIPVPNGQQSWVYPPLASPVSHLQVEAALPVGVGPVADGGDKADIHIKMEKFASAVDVYFAFSLPALDPGHFYLLQPDGSLMAHTKGIHPWKSGFVGPLDSRVFGEIPVSLLPPGICHLVLLVSPAGRLDRYYLWMTSFVVPESAGNVPDGSAGYFNGSLIVPNSTIIYQGEEYQGSAPVPSDTLVGIIRGGQAYLFHTSLNTAVLSDETTRKAVGRFVMGPAPGGVQSTASTISAASPPSGGQILEVGATKTLLTGVTLHRSEGTLVDAINNQRRWSAVKGTDGSGPFFIPPVARTVDNNLIRLIGTKLNVTESWFNASQNHYRTLTLKSESLVLQTYGAAWRPIPYYIDGLSEIGSIVKEILTGQPAPVVGIPIDGLDLRQQRDAALSSALDQIDLIYMVVEGVKAFYAAADVTEAYELFVNMACNIGMAIYHAWITGEAGSINGWSSIQSAFEDGANDLLSVGINIKTLGAATPFLSLLDVLSALSYTVEGVFIHDADVAGRWAYDEIQLKPGSDGPCVVGEWTWVNDQNCTDSVDSMFEFERYLGLSANGQSATMIGAGDGTWSLSGNTLDIEVHDLAQRTFRFVGTISNECRYLKGTYEEDGTPRGCWYAVKK